MTASADKSMITALKGVVQISISVVDKDNIPVMPSNDNVQRFFLGRMPAYVQATSKGGINIRLTALWLKPTEIAVTAE